MKMSQCRPTDELFTHISDDGLVRHFNASAMARCMDVMVLNKDAELVIAEMDPEFVTFIKERRGVEPWKVSRLKEPFLSLPLIGACMEDGSVLTVDGHHRMVVLHSMKRTSYPIYLVRLGAWAPFLVTDMPTDIEQFCIDDTLGQLRGS